MEKTIINTSDIPYEIRRNPLEITLFKNSEIKDHKILISPNHTIHKDYNNFIIKTNEIKKSNDNVPYVYVYRTMSLDNYGHFIIDNLIPLYKMIVLTQGYNFKRKDVLFCFLKAPKETEHQQTLTQKQIQLLSTFSSHPIRFIQDIPDMKINNIVLPFLGLGQSISFMKWHQYKTYNEDISKEFLKNFQKRIFNHFNIILRKPTKHVFLTRQGAKHRRVLNEQEVVKELCLEPITFQNKTIIEELQLFADSKLVVTPYGAGIVGCYFMQPNSTCIIIHPKGFDERYDFPQIYIKFQERLDINVSVFNNPIGNSTGNIFRNRDSNMTIDVAKLVIHYSNYNNNYITTYES